MTRPAVPPAHDAYHAVHLTEHPARAMVWTVVAAHLAHWIPRDAHVLEIGAGYCHWINAVRAARKVAVDMWTELPRHTAADVQPVVLDLRTGLRTLGPADQSAAPDHPHPSPFPEGEGGPGRTPAFDVVLASNVLEHFEPDAASAVVADVAALLRPGGRFLVIQPNFRYAYRQYFDDYTHRSIFTHVSLANLLRSHGLRIVESQPRFLPYSMRDTRSPLRPWLVRAYLRSPIKPGAGQMLIVAQKD